MCDWRGDWRQSCPLVVSDSSRLAVKDLNVSITNITPKHTKENITANGHYMLKLDFRPD